MKNEHETISVQVAEPPDPVAIIDRANRLVAGGFPVERIELRSGVDIKAWLLLTDEQRRQLVGKDIIGTRDLRTLEGLEKLEAWLDAYDASAGERDEFVETPTAREVRMYVVDALRRKVAHQITGSWRIGKTMTLRRAAAEFPMSRERAGVVYIPLEHGDNGTRILQKVAAAINLQEVRLSRALGLRKYVPDALRAGDVLVFDEGNYLFEREGWKTVRDLYDNSEASIVIACNPEFLDTMNAEKNHLQAFLSRFERHFIDSSSVQDVEAYMAARGFTGNEALLRQAEAIATQKNTHSTGIEALAKSLDRAISRAKQRGVSVGPKILEECYRAQYPWATPPSRRSRAKGGRA